MAAPVLTPSEADNPVWQKVKAHLEKHLATLRAQNDKSLDHDKTAFKRGRIAEVKRMLELDKPLPETEDE